MAEALSGVTGSIQGSLTGLGSRAQQWFDSIFPPEKRNQLLAWISKFASEKPMLASFLGSQIALTGFPLGLFFVLTISVAIFAILTGIILGLLGALLFIVTCAGFALIILLPTLFIAIGFATFIWLWGVGTYYIIKYFNEKPIPGIHKPLGEGLAEQMGVKDQLGAITGDGGPAGDPSGHGDGEEEEDEKAEGTPKSGSGKKTANGHAKAGQANGSPKGGGEKKSANGHPTTPNPKKAVDTGKNVGSKAQEAGGKAGDVGGKAQGAVGGVAGGAKGALPT